MEFVKERLGKWITACIILVVGIFCIVAGALWGNGDVVKAAETLDGMSTTLGIILIVAGGLAVVLAVVVAILVKKGFAAVAIPGAILVAFGISLVAVKYAGDLLVLLIRVVPFLLICVGAVILIDAIFNLVNGILGKNVKAVLVGVIVGAVLGIAAIVLGALCVGEDPAIALSVQLIVLGIIICLVAVLKVLLTFVKLPDAVVAVVTVDKKEEK